MVMLKHLPWTGELTELTDPSQKRLAVENHDYTQVLGGGQ